MANQVQIIVSAKDLATKTIQDVTKGLTNAAKVTDQFATSVSRMSIRAGIAFAGLQVSAKKLLDIGSDAVELENVVVETFGSMAKEINAWANDIAGPIGRSNYQMREFAGMMGAMIVPMMKNRELAADMSKEMAQLAVDMASFWNVTDEQTFNAIRSGLIGQIIPLQRFGINMNVASLQAFALEKGIRKSVQAMTESEKMHLRYQFLLENTAIQQGDAARNAGTYANMLKGLEADVRNTTEAFGELMQPLGIELVGNLRDAVQWFGNLDDEVKMTIIRWGAFGTALLGGVTVFGLVTKGIAAFVKGLSLVGSAIALLTSPLVLKIALISAGVALLAHAWGENMGGIQDKTKEVVETVQGYLWKLHTWWNGVPAVTPEGITSGFEKDIPGFKHKLQDGWEWVINFGGDAWTWLIDTTWAEKVQDIKGWLTDGWGWAINTGGDAWKYFTEETALGQKVEELRTKLTNSDLWKWTIDIAFPAVVEAGEAVIKAVVETGGAIYDAVKTGLDTGDWGPFWSVASDTWSKGVLLGITLNSVIGGAATAKAAIVAGLGLVQGVAASAGVAGVLGLITVGIQYMDAQMNDTMADFAADMIAALIAGLAVGGVTGSVAAGAVAFNITANLKLGSAFVDELMSVVDYIKYLLEDMSLWQILTKQYPEEKMSFGEFQYWQEHGDNPPVGSTKVTVGESRTGLSYDEAFGLEPVTPIIDDLVNVQEEFGNMAKGIENLNESLADLGRIIPITTEEIDEMVRMVHAEAEGESFEGKLGVAATIINRALSELFPDSVHDVLHAVTASGAYEFSPLGDGRFHQDINDAAYQVAYEAVMLALAGVDPTGGALFFHNPKTAPNAWAAKHRPYATSIGNHDFHYQSGGYTGDYPIDQAVGVVHGQEWVIPEKVWKKGIPSILEFLGMEGFRSGRVTASIPGISLGAITDAEDTIADMQTMFADLGKAVISGFATIFDVIFDVVEDLAVKIFGEEAVASVKETLEKGKERLQSLIDTLYPQPPKPDDDVDDEDAPDTRSRWQIWHDTFVEVNKAQADYVTDMSKVLGKFNTEAAKSLTNIQDFFNAVADFPEMVEMIQSGFVGLREQISALFGGGEFGAIAGRVGGGYAGWNAFSQGGTSTNWLGGLAGGLSGMGIGGPWTAGIALGSQIIGSMFPGKEKDEGDKQLKERIDGYNETLREWGASFQSDNLSFKADGGLFGWRYLFGNVKWETIGKELAEKGAELAERLIGSMQSVFDSASRGLFDVLFSGADLADFSRVIGQQLQQTLFAEILNMEAIKGPLQELSAYIAEAAMDGFTTGELANIKDMAGNMYASMEPFRDMAAEIAKEFGLAEESARGLNSTLRNAPSGYKVDLTRWYSAQGVAPSSISTRVPRGDSTRTVQVIINGNVNGVDDLKRTIQDALDEHDRKKGQDDLAYSGVMA